MSHARALTAVVVCSLALALQPSPATRLKTLCEERRARGAAAIALPGVHDALSARVFAEAGARALFVSGFGAAASRLGVPDAGIITRTQMEATAREIVRASRDAFGQSGPPPPVIADGDTGYGGAANVRATVRGLAAAGAAAVTIEDQRFPKRCAVVAGAGVRVVDAEAARARVRAALAARDEAADEILVVARTDCRAALGLDEAISRCVAFEALGADVVYAEGLRSNDEYAALRAALAPSTTTMLAQVDRGDRAASDVLSTDEVGAIGFDLALFGVSALQAQLAALQATARGLVGGGGGHEPARLAPFDEVRRVVGFDELDAFEAKYACD